ncbi:MAG: 4Fe-4S dicluster domain-containing protein [Dehalococcoidia bacterium]|nr:MAG: 4Fe-4S dicluster domain-containing protein [Dehalococcoidia bacterium]
MVTLSIDGKQVEVNEDVTVLEAAREAGIYIPTLCYHPSLPSDGSCELCLVRIGGRQDLPLACVTPVSEGMAVYTDTAEVRFRRRDVLRRILSRHPCACLTCWRRQRCQPSDICLRSVAVTERCVTCPKHGTCELEAVTDYIRLGEEELPYTYRNLPVDTDNPLFDRDYNLCISCSRCVRMCDEVRGIGAITMVERDGERLPAPSKGETLIESACRFCSACVEVCPTGALMDKTSKWQPERTHEEVAVPCHYACPAKIDVPLYVYLIGEGKFAAALAIIREKVPFPGVLGRVCIHPCEEACRRGQLNDPIAIKSLKRFVADNDTGQWKQFSKMLPPTGKKAAVVGSGPGGLTAAYYLAKLGHSVTVFEELAKAGGMMRVGIPDYRLPKNILDGEIEEVKRVGVDIKLNTRIESIDELSRQGYEAIFLALGAHRGMKMRVEGEDSPGVVDGASFLRKVALGDKVDPGKEVAVIGGGNAAIDSARTALSLGAGKVTILYRRTRAEMPASEEEIEGALEEGVEIVYLVAPTKISRDGKRLKLDCTRMKLGEPDASGRRRPVPIKGSEFSTSFDSIIAAIGQNPDIPSKFNLKLGWGDTITVDSNTLSTDRKGVFAGGDVVTGPASVIGAIAAGRKAASSIDRYLGGEGVIDEELTPERQIGLCVGKDEGFIDQPRVQMPCLPVKKRLGNFNEVELGFDEQLAVTEGRRCFQCGVRMQIPPPPLPPVRAGKKPEETKVVV